MSARESSGQVEVKKCPACFEHNVEKNRLFYGGKVCSRCRVFFRRSIVGQKTYVCECQAAGKRRKRLCRKCRLDRCLHKANMKPNLVSLESAKVCNSQILPPNSSFAMLDCMNSMDLNAFFEGELYDHVQKSHAKYFDFVNHEPSELPAFMLTLSGCGLSFTPHMHRALNRMDEMTLVNLIFQLEDTQSCSYWDRMTLINTSMKALNGVIVAWKYTPAALPL